MPPKEYSIMEYDSGVFTTRCDLVVEECLVEIFVNGAPYVCVMATPRQLDFLAVGLLFTEGAIGAYTDITKLSVNGLSVVAETAAPISPPPARARSSGFGLGSVAMDDILLPQAPALRPPVLAAARIVTLLEEFNGMSQLFQQTGGVHSAMLMQGGRRFFADDVGRHNAVDKVIGQYVEAGPAPAPALIVTTGRISTEILLKAAKAGVGAVISRSAATDRAVELAKKLGMLMVGFARANRFNIYNGEEFVAREQQFSSWQVERSETERSDLLLPPSIVTIGQK